MKSLADNYRRGLSPLWGLRCCRTKPTAHAVGYSLAAFRAYEAANGVGKNSDRVRLSGVSQSRIPAAAAAEQRQRVAHGVSRGLASQNPKPRRGERIPAHSARERRFAPQAIFVCFLLGVVTGCSDAKTGASGGLLVDSVSSTNDITTKVFERDRDKDGKPDFRMETVFRGGTKVMLVTSKPNDRGVMTVDSRSYLVNGDMVSSESDTDGDGVFDTIVAFNADSTNLEVFTRGADGTVQPASTQVVEEYRKQISAVSEFFDEALGEDANPDRFEELVRATQKKIQDAEKEKNH